MEPSENLIRQGKFKRGTKIKVRLVKVILKTKEVEILMTNLLDCEKYPTEIFQGLYNKRWSIETNYDKLKNEGPFDLVVLDQSMPKKNWKRSS